MADEGLQAPHRYGFEIGQVLQFFVAGLCRRRVEELRTLLDLGVKEICKLWREALAANIGRSAVEEGLDPIVRVVIVRDPTTREYRQPPVPHIIQVLGPRLADHSDVKEGADGLQILGQNLGHSLARKVSFTVR